jgi:hypothetical protein
MEKGIILDIIFSGIVALSTVVYAILTWCLVSETKKVRLATIQPQICITIVQDSVHFHIFNLEILNAGQGSAKNIRLTLDGEFQMMSQESLGNIGIFKNGISYMAPGQKITIKLANALTDWETLKKKEINLSVESKNILNSKITEKFQLSFDHFDGLYDTSDQRLSKITASLNNIDKALSGLASGTKKAKVISYSLEDIKTEAEHLNKRYQQTNNEEEREPNSITSHG